MEGDLIFLSFQLLTDLDSDGFVYIIRQCSQLFMEF